MSRKVPPRWTSLVAPEPGPVEGIDNLPIPSGVNASGKKFAEERSEATPGAMDNPMTSADYRRECNGDNPSIADVSKFASGQDVRSYGSSPSSPATPGKVGA